MHRPVFNGQHAGLPRPTCAQAFSGQQTSLLRPMSKYSIIITHGSNPKATQRTHCNVTNNSKHVDASHDSENAAKCFVSDRDTNLQNNYKYSKTVELAQAYQVNADTSKLIHGTVCACWERGGSTRFVQSSLPCEPKFLVNISCRCRSLQCFPPPPQAGVSEEVGEECGNPIESTTD